MAHELEVFWFSEQPYGHVTEDDLAPYESGPDALPEHLLRPPRRRTSFTATTTISTNWPTRWASTASCPTSTTVPTGA